MSQHDVDNFLTIVFRPITVKFSLLKIADIHPWWFVIRRIKVVSV